MANRDTQLNIIIDAQDKTRGTFANLEGQLGKADKSMGSMAKTAAVTVTAFYAIREAMQAVSGFVNTGFNVAASLQTAEIGLTTLLGSADKAAATVARLKIEASRTPFELPGLTQATQLLTSVTKDGDKSIDVILNIGEALAAMGKGQAELDRIIVNLQQIAATGKAATIDIKQFAFAGIPIYEMLAETTGKSGEALSELIEGGGVTFDVLTKMFDEANNSGGRFFNAYVNQAGSFNQATSNLKDSFGLLAADIVEKSGAFAGVTQAMIAMAAVMQNYEQVIASARERFSELVSAFDENTLIITHLKGALEAVQETFNEQLKPALDELMVALEPLKPYLEALATVFGALLLTALHTVIAALSFLAQAVTVALTVLTKVATFISEQLNNALELISLSIQAVSAVINGDFTGAWTALKGVVDTVYDSFYRVYKLIRDTIDAIADFGAAVGKKAIKGASDLLPGRAAGGPVTGNMPYIVGEKGPELFVPNQGGNIIPNHRLGGTNSISLILQGNTFLSEDAAEQMGDLIMNRLKLSSAL